MFPPNTLLVVGAGASKEVDLPLGGLLVEQISQALRFDELTFGSAIGSGNAVIYEAVRRQFTSTGYPKAFAACRQMSSALKHATSIDAYLEDFRENVEMVLCGKIAIAHIIAHAELHSSMRVDKSNIYHKPNWDGFASTWYPKFFRMLKEGVGLQNVENIFDNVTIVCFNYDRCIEHYLYYSLREYYALTPNDALSLLKKLKIFHPYGTIGPFEIDSQTGHSTFGMELRGTTLLKQATEIKTVYETRDTASEDFIKNAVLTSEQAIFLGFGFHQLNLDLLRSPGRNHTINGVYATCYEMPEPIAPELTRRIAKVFCADAAPEKMMGKVTLRGLTSRAMLDNYDLLMMAR